MKTKTILLSLLVSLIVGDFKTQNNASYQLNTSPINGTYNTGMGWKALRLTTTGRYNSALGYEALYNNTIGDLNVANGYHALYNNIDGHSNTANGGWALFSNTTGYMNVADGLNALYNNTTGGVNVAIGASALYLNNDGTYNTACGTSALSSNIVGNRNVAVGFQALAANIVDDNTATGYQSLANNSIGMSNSAFGNLSLFSNTTGNFNSAMGDRSLYANTIGASNAAFGVYACHDNSTGSCNSGFGYHALHQNSTGNENSAFGNQALDQNTGSYNTAIGRNALFSNAGGSKNTCVGASAFSIVNGGSLNTALGYNVAASTGLVPLNSTGIGANAVVTNSNEVQLGDANVTTIRMVNAWNYVGSDVRFKTNIKEDDVKGLEFIKLLRPVAYNFDTKKYTEFVTKNMPDSIRKIYLDKDFSQSTAIRKNGFIAQEVEKAAMAVNYDFDGVKAPKNENDHYIVAYSAFVVPLVKAVQEQQKMIEDQKQKNEMLEKELVEQRQMIRELLQKSNTSTGINQSSIDSQNFSMDQNEPNPFNNETVIKYTLAQTTVKAYMAIYDLSGKQIKTIDLVQKSATSLTITSDQLAAGIYIYSIVADGKVMGSKRMVVSDK